MCTSKVQANPPPRPGGPRQGEFYAPQVDPTQEPQVIPRPENESVVAAIKRLTATYPMLDKPQLLNETSALMTKHVMQGVGVVEVIDELEDLFLRFYNELISASGKENK